MKQKLKILLFVLFTVLFLSCNKPMTLVFELKNNTHQIIDSVSITKNDGVPKKIIALKPGAILLYKLHVENFEYRNQTFKLKYFQKSNGIDPEALKLLKIKPRTFQISDENILGYYLSEEKARQKLHITFEENRTTYDF